MARKGGRKIKMARAALADVVDATPERIAMEPSVMVPVEIDKAGDRGLTTRRFAATHIDRLHKSGRLTYRQHLAAEWFRAQHERARLVARVVANYEPTIPSTTPAFGLAPTEAAHKARMLWRAADNALPSDMRGYVGRLVLHDEYPRYGGRSGARSLVQLCRALDQLADWLNLPR